VWRQQAPASTNSSVNHTDHWSGLSVESNNKCMKTAAQQGVLRLKGRRLQPILARFCFTLLRGISPDWKDLLTVRGWRGDGTGVSFHSSCQRQHQPHLHHQPKPLPFIVSFSPQDHPMENTGQSVPMSQVRQLSLRVGGLFSKLY
jgi:hypothetical protein